jgi:hypothetical protein
VVATVVGDTASSLDEDAGGIVYTPKEPGEKVLIKFALADDPSVSEELILQVGDVKTSSVTLDTSTRVAPFDR